MTFAGARGLSSPRTLGWDVLALGRFYDLDKDINFSESSPHGDF